ncbi:hypothetical protein Pelo_17641 [Pelomyxa schiedti]|nr:hypothetical protein Pelo_17641 [Pelomyxa schiedti]
MFHSSTTLKSTSRLLRGTCIIFLNIIISSDHAAAEAATAAVTPAPSGETVTSFHNHSLFGGMLSRDMGQGYGPVEYLISKSMPGAYTIAVQLFSAGGKTVVQPVTACVSIYTYFGNVEMQKMEAHVVQLRTDREQRTVATVVFS